MGDRPNPLESPPPENLSVITFGAAGGGTTDDTDAFQQAFDAAAAGGVAVVEVPPGDYRLRSGITFRSGVSLRGAGRDVSRLCLWDGEGNFSAWFTGTGLNNTSVSGLTFDLNTRGNPVSEPGSLTAQPRFALLASDSDQFTVTNCRFTNADTMNTVVVNGRSTDAEVSACIFDETGAGSSDHDHSSIYIHAQGMTIRDNVFTGAGAGARTAIETHGGAQIVTANRVKRYICGMNITGVADASDDVLIADNTIEGARWGILLWSYFYGANAASPALRNVILRGNRITLDGDKWAGGGGTPTLGFTSGIALEANSDAPVDGLTIEDNTITQAPFAYAGVQADWLGCGVAIWRAASAAPITNLRIRGNTIEGVMSAGVLVNAAVDGLDISGNTIRDAGRLRDVIWPEYRSGVYTPGAITNGNITGNIITDDQPEPTMLVGVRAGTVPASGNTVSIGAM